MHAGQARRTWRAACSTRSSACTHIGTGAGCSPAARPVCSAVHALTKPSTSGTTPAHADQLGAQRLPGSMRMHNAHLGWAPSATPSCKGRQTLQRSGSWTAVVGAAGGAPCSTAAQHAVRLSFTSSASRCAGALSLASLPALSGCFRACSSVCTQPLVKLGPPARPAGSCQPCLARPCGSWM